MSTKLPYRTTGAGPALLLIHGAAEDAAMLTPLAHAFAARGNRVAWYDRRGTGVTPRAGWPAGGVRQHAADAAAIVRELGGPVRVIGFSSGGVVAIELAVAHSELDIDVVAWEPAALSALEGGLALHEQMLEPILGHIAAFPGDWPGAFAVQLQIVSDGRADLGSPEVAAQMVNAEAAVRDDAALITRHEFAAGSVPADRVRVARSKGASTLHAQITERMAVAHGLETIVVDAADDHEVYLSAPDVLAARGWGWRR